MLEKTPLHGTILSKKLWEDFLYSEKGDNFYKTLGPNYYAEVLMVEAGVSINIKPIEDIISRVIESLLVSEKPVELHMVDGGVYHENLRIFSYHTKEKLAIFHDYGIHFELDFSRIVIRFYWKGEE